MLTIGQLANLAGVTVRTVRHYHHSGLLEEPGRDESGYRRYRAAHLIRLLRIRALAEIGLPLARIGHLLEAPRTELAACLEELDAELALQAERIAQHRALIADLRDTDPRLPPQLHAITARLSGAGLTESAIAAERDALLLAEAMRQKGERTWTIVDFYARFDDPEAAERLVELWRRFERAGSADGSAIDELVADFIALLEEHREALELSPDARPDPLAAMLIADHIATLPAPQRVVVERVARHFGG